MIEKKEEGHYEEDFEGETDENAVVFPKNTIRSKKKHEKDADGKTQMWFAS